MACAWTASLQHVTAVFRYPDAVMLWVESEASVLNKRLDDRVDKMVESGMLDEMLQFHDKFNKDRIEMKGRPAQWETDRRTHKEPLDRMKMVDPASLFFDSRNRQ